MTPDLCISIGGKIVELLVEPIGRRFMYIDHPRRNIPIYKLSYGLLYEQCCSFERKVQAMQQLQGFPHASLVKLEPTSCFFCAIYLEAGMVRITGIFKSIGEKVGEELGEWIVRQLMYIVRPRRNIPNLTIQLQKLEALRKGVQDSIGTATRNRQVIRADVTQWMDEVDKVIKEVGMFLESVGRTTDDECLSKLIPNPATRYHIGKWAEEKTKEVDELLQQGGNFTVISNPPPPLGIEAMPSESAVMAYKATQSTTAEVMEALRDDNINFIGIHGIAGVGKTTMVKYVGKKVKEDKLFDEVVMAVVSQNKDIGKIQSEIAGWLDFVLTDDQIMLRATKLCDRIKQVRRILVILDDVWDNLYLVAVGIPSNNDHQGCKIIITTRREQVYRSMGMVGRRNNIALNVLSEEDSWHLFRSKAGFGVDFPKLNAIAREVWRECGNLPLALVMVGSAMSGKQDADDWKEAAQQLKNASPDDIDGVEEQVYRSIKLSFDYLKCQSAQNLILLCTLFPEDHNICIEDMVRYGWGLRMLRGSVDTVQGARRRTKTMINNLKEASLLLPSDREGYVKMHDLVRDVAISIRWDKYIRSDNWPIEGISLMGDTSGNYLSVKDFTNTKILLVMGNEIESWSCSHHLSKLKELNVVYVNNRIGQGYFAGGRTVLGSGSYAFFHQQTCLRTLVLRNIDGPDIGAIGKIITLEILDLRGCRFHEAPDASCIRGLTNLRVLDLRDTTGQVCCLEDGADSSMVSPHLTRLEELYLGDGILLSWDDMNILRKLPRLKVLIAHLANIQTMPRDFVFPHHLDLLRITLGCSRSLLAWDNHTTPSLKLEDMVKETSDLWRGSLKALLTNCVGSLTIHHCGKVVSVFPDLTDKTDDLKLLADLSISFCEGFRYIIDTGDDVWDEAQQMLSSLEYLKLSHLRRLECLFKLSSTATPHVVYLCNLKRVEMGHCDSLRYLFQPEIAHSLAQLEELRLWYCLKLEEIIADDQGDTDEEKKTVLVFPNLKHVSLKCLPNLRGFCCRGDLLFDCPSLEQLHVFHCPKMTSFAANQSSTPKLKSVQFHEGLEVIPQGMDLNQFLLQN